ncbi:MAG: DoxX family membrane protein [Gemmatimonadetes bacterium]|nr:DoxX family membrane protein [Gemmatimonadota bacterium]NNK61631.1 DoxX family membrane protein [Gemmatimonadota bacterium]
MSRSADAPLGGFQLTTLVVLRMLVGWHFLYEGVAKITSDQWTSAGYLQESPGWFSGFFQDLAANPEALVVVDALNEWGLILIGLALLVGVFTRTATTAGIVLLALYYLAAPPLPGLEYTTPAEGSYLIVNKVLVELAALMVLLALPTSHRIGLDRLLRKPRTTVEAT